MDGRGFLRFRPRLERFEVKQLLSVNPTAPAVSLGLDPAQGALVDRVTTPQELANERLLLSRITNPTPTNAQLIPPFQQVRVQTVTPVTGSVYNVLFVSVRNSTSQTFDAGDGFHVKLSGGKTVVPILTGSQQWKPGQVIVFYILSKKYYPLSPQVSAGFVFNFRVTSGTAIPGPSGIYQRVTYNPATIEKTINDIVPFGPGAKGHLLGLPDTAIWEFTAKPAENPARDG